MSNFILSKISIILQDKKKSKKIASEIQQETPHEITRRINGFDQNDIKRTTPSIPMWPPTVALTRPYVA